jgi:hypothetical protein
MTWLGRWRGPEGRVVAPLQGSVELGRLHRASSRNHPQNYHGSALGAAHKEMTALVVFSTAHLFVWRVEPGDAACVVRGRGIRDKVHAKNTERLTLLLAQLRRET